MQVRHWVPEMHSTQLEGHASHAPPPPAKKPALHEHVPSPFGDAFASVHCTHWSGDRHCWHPERHTVRTKARTAKRERESQATKKKIHAETKAREEEPRGSTPGMLHSSPLHSVEEQSHVQSEFWTPPFWHETLHWHTPAKSHCPKPGAQLPEPHTTSQVGP